jgi:O-antigen ligase
MYRGNYLLNSIPFILIIIYLAIFKLDSLLFLIIFLTPLSIPLRELIPNVSNDINLPSEPLLFGVLIIVIFKALYQKSFDKRIILHPISIAIYINLLWIFITSLTSTMPIVSLKFTLSRVWFLTSYFLLAAHLFHKKKNIFKYLWLYISSYIVVIGYTLYRQSGYGFFDQKIANHLVSPLLPDHTSYAAIIAMLLPFMLFSPRLFKSSRFTTISAFIVILIFIIGLIFSYTRAAWISLALISIIAVIMLLRIKFKIIFSLGLGILILLFSFQTEIKYMLEKNNQDSSDNFSEQIESVSNISTDASNLERINRWNSAIRMFQEKPFLGFGPATYMFQYAPYQFSYDKTIISTNAGDRGNAHSEYLGPLSEEGVFGLLSILLVIGLTIYTALNLYRKEQNRFVRLLSMIIILGLFTYYIHGFLNDFLDLDKTSALFWGFTAIIVALDVYHSNPKGSKE